MNFFEERGKLINEMFGIFKSLQGVVASTSTVTATIPKIDNLIMSQKDSFLEHRSKGKNSIGRLTQQKIINFIDVRSKSILKMYSKTFDAYHRSLDYLNERIAISTVGLAKGIENTKTDMEGALADKRQELENQVKNLVEDYKISLSTMQAQIKDTDLQLKRKFDSEVVRLTEHFDKIVTQREETLSLTSASLTKAQDDLKNVTQQREAELRTMISKNDEVLDAHSESMMSRLVVDEQKAAELEKAFTEVFKTHSTLGPELDRQWREKSKKLKEEFNEEDDLYDMDIKQKKLQIEDLSRQLNEANTTYQSQKVEIDDKIQASAQIYAKNIQKLIDERPLEIEKAKAKANAEFLLKEQKLKESLEKMREKIAIDAELMKSKINDKSGAHTDKVAALEEDQKRAVSELESQKQEILDQIEAIKSTWDDDRQKIIDAYEQDIKVSVNKSEMAEKYFKAKLAALKKELDLVMTENSSIEQLQPNFKGIKDFDNELRSKEAELSSALESKMSIKVQQAVNEKLAELKKLHDEEKAKLIEQMRRLEGKESQLIENQNSTDSSPLVGNINSGHSHEKLTRAPSSTVKQLTIITSYLGNDLPSNETGRQGTSRKSTGRAIPSFATQQFLDSQIDKWREDYLADSKSLKQKQAHALKELDDSKQDFQKAVEHVNKLKQRLEVATKEYTIAIQQSASKNEEELGQLKKVIEDKEKLISELEIQFEENEMELKRRARQIEAVEDKLSHLKEHLDESKKVIQKKISEEYTPLLFKEQKKCDEKVCKLRDIRNELELQLEFMKNDLFVIESANAAMEDSLRKETQEMVERLKNDLNSQCSTTEEEFSQRLSEEESAKQDEVSRNLAAFEKEVNDNVDSFNEEMRHLDEIQQEQITSINDYCIEVISDNSEKKKRIYNYQNVKCDKCGVLQKNVKHLEKEIVLLQIKCRDAHLEDINNKFLYKTFKPAPLPPLNPE